MQGELPHGSLCLKGPTVSTLARLLRTLAFLLSPRRHSASPCFHDALANTPLRISPSLRPTFPLRPVCQPHRFRSITSVSPRSNQTFLCHLLVRKGDLASPFSMTEEQGERKRVNGAKDGRENGARIKFR